MRRTLHISEKEIKKQSAQILQPVKYEENAVGVCYPGCKISYNLSCFLNDRAILRQNLGPYYKRFVFITIQLDEQETVESFLTKFRDSILLKSFKVSNSTSILAMSKNIIDSGKSIYIFLLNAHSLKTEVLKDILHVVHVALTQSVHIRATIFFEANIQRPEIAKILQTNNKFLHNLNFFPVYSQEESTIFVQTLCRAWNVKISAEIIQKIVSSCGGSLWLLRETIRFIREYKTTDLQTIMKSSGIQLRAEYIYNLFTSEEIEVLASIVLNKVIPSDTHIVNYLLQTGVIYHSGQNYVLALPLLENYLSKTVKSRVLRLEQNRVILDSQDITDLLTPAELHLLVLLLRYRSSAVSKEQIAQVIWGNNWTEKYSDWALDKLLSRLRKTIVRFGLPETIIETKKGRGVILH